VPTNPHASNNINQGCTWRAVSMAGWTDSRNGTQKKDKKQKEKNPAQFPRSKSAKGADETFLPTCHTTRHIEKGIFKQKETRHFLFLFLLGYLGPIFECDGKWILQQLKGEHLYTYTPVGRGGRSPLYRHFRGWSVMPRAQLPCANSSGGTLLLF
jgi:hypothetical protein